MHFSNTFLTLAPLALLARADLDLDINDTPQVCRSICQPIATLGDQCNVDLPGDNNDRQEDLLELQCFCTNNSFDVSSVAALCQDCIRQNQNNSGNDDADDALEDINKIVRSCSFSSTSYAASAATSYIQSVTVTATRPTDPSQLTTTYNGAPRTTTQSNSGSSSTTTDGAAATTSSGSSNDNGNAASGQVASLLLAGGFAGAVAAALC
ncbi:unnamed protein product [Clonostachys rhizophaga]|uniref:Protein CAP22 n=1 Tax=Clonostachys rhizophaga TaxID=160324 RepID=A0A9N9YH68_9HYPO|nr:unnamed protein product [Clonostachys rhizophaga]